jgi:hypothetical protein
MILKILANGTLLWSILSSILIFVYASKQYKELYGTDIIVLSIFFNILVLIDGIILHKLHDNYELGLGLILDKKINAFFSFCLMFITTSGIIILLAKIQYISALMAVNIFSFILSILYSILIIIALKNQYKIKNQPLDHDNTHLIYAEYPISSHDIARAYPQPLIPTPA